jgi:hypothetical protein
MRLLFGGLGIREDQTIQDLDLRYNLASSGHAPKANELYLELLLNQCGGKPVIYLYPTEQTSIDVSLSLCPQCKYTHS